MKRVGILTINDYQNYGNRLQNYALQEVLKSLGVQPQTIVNKTQHENERFNGGVLKKIKKYKDMSIKKIYIKSYLKLRSYLYNEQLKEIANIRLNAFKQFTKDYINETNYFITDKNIPDDLANKFDYFITGSDQVWNPLFARFSEIDFLTFAPKIKRISYSASFGVSEIPDKYINCFKNWLQEMNKLSVREEDGARIIKELTGRNAVVLIDPTLLLTKKKWLSIVKQAKNKPKSRYLLTYFIGELPGKYRKQIKKIAKNNNLLVIDLNDIRNKETYVIGPNEFVDYINSCSLFCTDSFHGVVFSILFEKPFIVYKRIGVSFSMYSRIETLLNKFDLNSRKAENIKTNEDVFNIDYSHVPSILEKERNKALNYLKEALDIKEEE